MYVSACFQKRSGMQKESIVKIREMMVSVGHWLAGNLEVVKNDVEDNRLLNELNDWLHVQIQKNDPLMTGVIQCLQCKATWEEVAYKQSLSRLQCPHCGATETSPVKL